MSNLISQETGTLSIGRYSGELKAGQIFSGGNNFTGSKNGSYSNHNYIVTCLTGSLRIHET